VRVSRQPFPVKSTIDQKQVENVESFKYLGSILTNDGRSACEIKCSIAIANDLSSGIWRGSWGLDEVGSG
jgi:hypothetical protein